MAGRRRLVLLGLAGATAVAAFAFVSPGAPAQQLVTGAKPTTTTGPTTTTSSTTTTSTTTPPPPYSNPSAELTNLVFTASKTSTTITGSFLITNVSGDLPTDIVVVQQRVMLEYKTSANGKYTLLPAPTCTFTPTAPYTIPFQQQQSVSFTCTLASPIPSTAKFVRLTVIVNLQGRDVDFRLAEAKAV